MRFVAVVLLVEGAESRTIHSNWRSKQPLRSAFTTELLADMVISGACYEQDLSLLHHRHNLEELEIKPDVGAYPTTHNGHRIE